MTRERGCAVPQNEPTSRKTDAVGWAVVVVVWRVSSQRMINESNLGAITGRKEQKLEL